MNCKRKKKQYQWFYYNDHTMIIYKYIIYNCKGIINSDCIPHYNDTILYIKLTAKTIAYITRY